MSDVALVAAPYVGEFGWELMNWQALVRRVFSRRMAARRIVFARSDKRSLYLAAASAPGVEFIPADDLSLAGEANEDHRILPNGSRMAAESLRTLLHDYLNPRLAAADVDSSRVEWLMPPLDGRLWPARRPVQQFVSLRRCAAITTDVLLVPRRRATATERNLPGPWWDKLEGLLRDAGLSTEFYGSTFDQATSQLSCARLAVGASTGGMHLASLTRTPHYVWGSDDGQCWTSARMTNRQRYETYWNPLGTACEYDDCGWQPTAEYVFHRTLDVLARIGLPRGSERIAWRLRPRWRIRRGLARLTENRRGNPTPWRVRRFVQEQLV